MNDFFESVQKEIADSKNLYVGIVTKIENDSLNGSIFVRIEGVDDKLTDKQLPIVKPAFSHGFFWCYPKVGENVLVALNTKDNTERFWLSIINQNPQNLNFADKNELNNFTKNAKANGVYGEPTDVIIQGRNNTDIRLSEKNDGEVLIRSGRFKKNKNEFDTESQAYIQLKKNSKAKKNISVDKTKEVFYIPPTHFFNVVKLGLDYILNIYVNDTIVWTFKTDNINLLKKEIQLNKTKFPKWKLVTLLKEFKNWQIFYGGYKNVKNVNVVKEDTSDEKLSVINIAADKIFLFSHLKTKNVLDNKDLVTNERQKELEKELQSMVNGEKLVELLSLMVKVLVNHTHPFDNLASTQDSLVKKLVGFGLDSILNENIKTG
jgi:hypothetical protein